MATGQRDPALGVPDRPARQRQPHLDGRPGLGQGGAGADGGDGGRHADPRHGPQRLSSRSLWPKACLVLSHDAGQKAADYLAERYGIEQWCRGLPLPIGFTNTRRWLTRAGRAAGGRGSRRRSIIAQGETMVVEACRRKGLEQSAMHRAPAAIVADATVGIPLLRFITEDLEMIPTPGLPALRPGGRAGDAGARAGRAGPSRAGGVQRRRLPVQDGAGRGQAGDGLWLATSSGTPSRSWASPSCCAW